MVLVPNPLLLCIKMEKEDVAEEDVENNSHSFRNVSLMRYDTSNEFKKET